MLPKHHRLNSEQEIASVLKTGRRFSCPQFSLCCVVNTGDKNPRFGFLVSKKVSNKTTGRNLVKRRMRHIVSRLLSDCQLGARCIFIARPKSLIADYALLEAGVRRSLVSLGVIKSHS